MFKAVLLAAVTLTTTVALAEDYQPQPSAPKNDLWVKGATFYELCDELVACKNYHFESNETLRTKREKENFWKHQSQLGSVGSGTSGE